MERNYEALRHLFVSHLGKQTLTVHKSGRPWSVTIDDFRSKIQENVRTSWLSDWISPGFSTSTVEDERTATILMMGVMKGYFQYVIDDTCGIPSITLLGRRQDWQRLIDKIDRLSSFGEQPSNYAKRLRPLLSRFVRTFDDPMSTESNDFWSQIVHAKVKHESCCGRPPLQYMVSGWILGFFYWEAEGRVNQRFAEGWADRFSSPGGLVYDDVHYGQVPLEDIPVGYAKANVRYYNAFSQECWNGYVLAGSIGKNITDGAPDGYYAIVGYPKSDASVEKCGGSKPSAGCLSGFFKALNCFGGKVKSSRQITASSQSGSEDEKLQKEQTKYAVDANEKAQDEESDDDTASSMSRPKAYQIQEFDFERDARKPKPKPKPKSIIDEYPPLERKAVVPLQDGHTTIQPLSGWFLFTPDYGPGPFYDGEEVFGPTVDAIDSCEGTEHYREG
jgi:hypothetical protein